MTRCVGYIVVIVYPLEAKLFATGDCVELGGGCLV
jgi:hypothetical protein